MKRLRSKLTYSNVVSTLCLFLLIGGGTAFAAAQFEKESVGTRALKKEAVTPLKLSQKAKATLQGPQGPQGPKGETGATGSAGPQGPKGATGLTNQRLVDAVGIGSVTTECAAGETLTGGGAYTASGGALKGSYPNVLALGHPGRWTAQAVNDAEVVVVRIFCSSP